MLDFLQLYNSQLTRLLKLVALAALAANVSISSTRSSSLFWSLLIYYKPFISIYGSQTVGLYHKSSGLSHCHKKVLSSCKVHIILGFKQYSWISLLKICIECRKNIFHFYETTLNLQFLLLCKCCCAKS